jgi:RimJ/RimL family protein N-acetyltransferase
MRYRFYQLGANDSVRSRSLDPALTVELWRPSWREVAPSGVTGHAFKVWWLFHHLRIFANPDYALLLVRHRGRLIHRSGVYPRYFRFPFMAASDLQIGDTWTDPEYRRRGLAHVAIYETTRRLAAPGRRFWYLVGEDNPASIGVIEQAGFQCVGDGDRVPRWGIGLLGAYRLSSGPAATGRSRHSAH